jgi:hypothetical protein
MGCKRPQLFTHRVVALCTYPARYSVKVANECERTNIRFYDTLILYALQTTENSGLEYSIILVMCIA